jgi:hypothetical protein
MQTRRTPAVFHRNLLLPCTALKLKAEGSSEVMVTFYQTWYQRICSERNKERGKENYIYMAMRAIWKVISSELLTKQVMRKIVHYIYTYIHT